MYVLFCNYTEYESKDDKNKFFSLDKHLNKNKTYLRNTIIDLHNSCTWKIQVTIYFFKRC